MISKEIEFCMQDMRNAACTGRISLDSQVRAYDLLDRLMSLPQGVYDLLPSAQEFCQTYESLADSLEAAYIVQVHSGEPSPAHQHRREGECDI